jgi:hypothetical protein
MKVRFFGPLAHRALAGHLATLWIRWYWEWKKNNERTKETNGRCIDRAVGPFGLLRVGVRS